MEREITGELQFRGTCDHVTLMSVVSAACETTKLLVVFPGVEARYGKRPNGKYETTSDYLAKPNYLHMRTVAGVDTNIFYAWAKRFVEQTAVLREDGSKLLLSMDGYASHVSFKKLRLIWGNGIVAAGLPAHTPYVLQPLEVSIFGPVKEDFRRWVNIRTV